MNLYAYCKNNPVVYYDPSGYDQVARPSNGPETTNAAGVEKGAQQSGNATGSLLEGVYKEGLCSVGDANFMDTDDVFASYIGLRADVDTDGYYDVIAHGTSNGIQITHNGQHMIVDHRTAARLIQNSDGYNSQAIRLLSCNTGAVDNGFAQNLANKLNTEVYAPTNYLWVTQNGNYFVAGMTDSKLPNMNDIGIFKLFTPGGNCKWYVKNVRGK